MTHFNLKLSALFFALMIPLAVIAEEPESKSESETPLLDELSEKYDLDNPERNFRDLDKLSLETSNDNDSRTQSLLNRYLMSEPDNTQLDYSGYESEYSQGEMQQLSRRWALRSSSTAGMPSLNDEGGINLEYRQNGTLRFVRGAAGEYSFEATDGGATRSSGLSQADIFSQEVNHEDHERFEGIKDSYQNEEQLYSRGSTNISQLRNQDSLTSDALAYRTLLGTQERALENQIDESFLEGTRTFLDDFQNDPSSFFSGCQVTTNTETIGATGTLKDDFICQEVDRNNYDFCELRREVSVKPIFNEIKCLGDSGLTPYMVDGQEHMSCNGTMTPVTDIQDNVSSDSWRFSEYLGQQENYTGRLYLQQIGEQVVDTITQFPKGCYDNATYTGDDLSGGGGSCSNECPDWMPFTIEQDKFGEQPPLQCQGLNVSETPNSCTYELTAAFGTGDIACEGNFETIARPNQCEDGEQPGYPGNEGACTFDEYEIIEEGDRGFAPEILEQTRPMFPNDEAEISWKVNLTNYACEPFEGEEICIDIDNSGEAECKTWYEWFGRHDDDLSEFPEEHTALVDSCALYKEENCTRRESECADGFVDEKGHCRIKDVRYECSTGVGGTRTVTTESTSCDAMIPCAGGDCDDTADETNNDFVKAATQASLLHEMSVDNNCIGEDGDTGDCEVFTGTFGSCARAVGLAGAVKLGGPDCCDDPTAVGVMDYIVAARQVAQFDAVRNTASWAATPVKGAYDKIASGAGTAWNKVTSSFTSGAESLAGNATGATAEGNILDRGMEALQEATMKWMAENLPSGVTQAIFATELGKDGITTVVSDPPRWSEGMQSVGNFAQGLMTAYSYYTMAKLFMDIAFQCDDDESEVAGARMQKQCVYLGSGSCRLNLIVTGCVRRNYHYCCFNSILARIIMEQAAEQLDRPLGSGEACRGLTLAELSQLNWDLIDLESEWIPLMFESDYIVSDPSENALTGTGRTINSDAREAVSKRTKDRFRNISDGDTRDIDSEMRKTLDCSKYPRPAVCNYPAGGG